VKLLIPTDTFQQQLLATFANFCKTIGFPHHGRSLSRGGLHEQNIVCVYADEEEATAPAKRMLAEFKD
jgi:hypothetical protein